MKSETLSFKTIINELDLLKKEVIICLKVINLLKKIFIACEQIHTENI